MKKLFVSVPVIGRRESDIQRSILILKNIAEAAVGERLELIYSYIDGDELKEAKELYVLGLRISAMQAADYFACIDESYLYKETAVEHEVARLYKIQTISCSAKYVCPDIKINKSMAPVFDLEDFE